MLLTTTENIPGKTYEIIGIAKGSMIQSKNIGRDIGQGLKSVVGGELKTYVEMMNESRSIATQRMVEDAERMGADAVVMMRYSTSGIMAGAAEVMAYGTAVRYVRILLNRCRGRSPPSSSLPGGQLLLYPFHIVLDLPIEAVGLSLDLLRLRNRPEDVVGLSYRLLEIGHVGHGAIGHPGCGSDIVGDAVDETGELHREEYLGRIPLSDLLKGLHGQDGHGLGIHRGCSH